MHTGQKVSTFRERFISLIDESGKTLSELAKDLHVSNQTVSAWKTGARSPKEPTIIAIADHFGVDVRWLMGFDVPRDVERRVPPVNVMTIEQFGHLMQYMDRKDYDYVIAAFDKAYRKMKEIGVEL